MNYESNISLRPFLDSDVPIFDKWLNKEYIYKWFCPGGETEAKDWLDEVNFRVSKYKHYTHFIVTYNGLDIGFCLFIDLYFEPEYLLETYGVNVEQGSVYEIGFLIGEEEYLGKGIGKIIVKKLEEKIVELGGKEIWSDPNEGNILSIKTLKSNGFVKVKDGDYRKEVFSG
jgi:RimJ/RimL family protein N-acetyltransferase